MVTLVIMDGLGISKRKIGNAVYKSKLPNLSKLADYPFTTLAASGEAVGLCENQMGNSEVGHLNIGAGRVVYQDLPKIDNAIKDGSFFENDALLKAINFAKQNNSCLHLMGLVSNGGVHSHINHLVALVDMANKNGLFNVCIHAILDGRDTHIQSGLKFVEKLEKQIKGKAKIKSVMGRFYAMDREKRWDRTQIAYNTYALGKADGYYESAKSAIKASYANKVYDEFMKPCIIGKPQTINSNDSCVFFNFRSDRARQIVDALTQENFNHFERKHFCNLCFVCFANYDSNFKNLLYAFSAEKIENNLASIISNAGKSQYHCSETTKYAHVTFFFNGGIEQPYPNEERCLVESDNIANFATTPKMKAYEITDKVLHAIASNKFDFVLCNLSNADMVGHTGNFAAATEAVETVDKCAYTIALATLMAGGHCIITADHGNAEQMVDSKGNVCTTHTTNPVPLYLISNQFKNAKLKQNKSLTSIAPTILQLLNIEVPQFMDQSLIEE